MFPHLFFLSLLRLTWYNKANFFFSSLMASSASSSSSSSSSTIVPSLLQLHHFHTPISLKLDDDNFLVWKHQVLAMLRGLNFMHFLTGESVPSRYLLNAEQKQFPNPLISIINNEINLWFPGFSLRCLQYPHQDGRS